jgi:dTDP-4-amino-4,6-dideoxygalactose transaminase
MISFLDLKVLNSKYAQELNRVAIEVINSGWYLQSEKVKCFESELSSYIDVKHAIGVANGLDALRLILKAYIQMGEMKEGDEVIVPANTYIATILAITDNRLKPVLVEPDIKTYLLDVPRVVQHITAKTKAIMVVHLYGQVCWSVELEDIAKKYKLKIIEDNAQAIGATFSYPVTPNTKHKTPNIQHRTERSGALGDAAGFSFYPGKNLGALGDAGAVTTNDDDLAYIIRALANYGSGGKYIHDYQGINSRLDEVQAAFLEIKLKWLDKENQHRREIAQHYCSNISHPDITLPFRASPFSNKHQITNNLAHVWHLFIIRHPERDKLQRYLYEQGIQTLIHYPVPPHKQTAYLNLKNLNLPVTERIHREVLSLPLNPVMDESEIVKIITTLNSYKQSKKKYI